MANNTMANSEIIQPATIRSTPSVSNVRKRRDPEDSSWQQAEDLALERLESIAPGIKISRAGGGREVTRIVLHTGTRVASTLDVKVKTLEKFQAKLASAVGTAERRLTYLKGLCTTFPATASNPLSKSQLWIEHEDEHYLSLMIDEGEYESNAVPEGVLHAARDSYIHIKIFEEEKLDSPLLHLRVDRLGESGEIIYVKSGEHIAGGKIKQIGMELVRSLGIGTVYLNDDAKYPLPLNGTRKADLLMRAYLPIVSESGVTWYEKDGFKPVACQNIQSISEGERITQNPEEYIAAVEKVRTTTLSRLKEMFPTRDRTSRTHLQTLQRKYSIADDQTVHEFGKVIFAQVRTSLDARKDFALFYRYFLMTRILPHTTKAEYKTYNNAVDCIRMHCLWKFENEQETVA